jgi:hypothetical protein
MRTAIDQLSGSQRASIFFKSRVYYTHMKLARIIPLCLICLTSLSAVARANPYGWCGGGYRPYGWGYGGGCAWYGNYGAYYWPTFALGAVNATANIVAASSLYYRPPVYVASPQIVQSGVFIPQYTESPQIIREVRTPRASSTSDPTLAKAQAKLEGLGYYKGAPDGIFGEQTKIALLEFQGDASYKLRQY